MMVMIKFWWWRWWQWWWWWLKLWWWWWRWCCYSCALCSLTEESVFRLVSSCPRLHRVCCCWLGLFCPKINLILCHYFFVPIIMVLKSQGGWGVWMGLCRPPCHTRQVPSRLPPASILLLYHRYHHHSLFWPLSRFQRSPLRSTVLYGKHKKEQICETRHSVLISWVALSSFIVCSSVRRGDISFSFPPLKAFTIYLHCVMMF